jgi:hypothetical protein
VYQSILDSCHGRYLSRTNQPLVFTADAARPASVQAFELQPSTEYIMSDHNMQERRVNWRSARWPHWPIHGESKVVPCNAVRGRVRIISSADIPLARRLSLDDHCCKPSVRSRTRTDRALSPRTVERPERPSHMK